GRAAADDFFAEARSGVANNHRSASDAVALRGREMEFLEPWGDDLEIEGGTESIFQRDQAFRGDAEDFEWDDRGGRSISGKSEALRECGPRSFGPFVYDAVSV